MTLDDGLLRQLKQKAASEGRSLQAVIGDLLRQGLARPATPGSYTLSFGGWQAVEQPGVDILDRDKLFDLMSGR